MDTRITLSLTPNHRLLLVPAADALVLDERLAERLVDAFERGSGEGLLQLGGAEIGQSLPPVFAYWRVRPKAIRVSARAGVSWRCSCPASENQNRGSDTIRAACRSSDLRRGRRRPLYRAPAALS